MLIIAIIILTVLTLKFKMHPVMVLFLTATFCGLASGKTLVDTFAAITKYFGSTLGSIGVMIIFGAVIASGINDNRRCHQHGQLLHQEVQGQVP